MKKTCIIPFLLFMILLVPVAVSAVGNISVNSVPTGAAIFLDDTSTVSTTNAVLEGIPAGSHTVRLRKSGYLDYSIDVVVADNQTFTFTSTLVTTTPAPTITSITPSSGYNTSLVSITSLTGTGFATSGTPTIVLMKTGLTNISATSVSVTATQITCNFEITGMPAGYRDVVITNPDGQSSTLTNGFEIKNPGTAVTLTSITPTSGLANTTVTITDLSGSGFLNTATIRLKRTNYNDILGTSVAIISSSRITGSFDLTNRAPGIYEVCVLNDGTTPTCGPAFTINSAASVNGSITIKSYPTTSKVFLGSAYKGYTPLILDDITPGTYTVMVQRADYNSYSESVKVTPGNTSYVTASLVLVSDETAVTTTVPKTTVKTVKTTAKSTAKVPTPWPTATPTPASPVSILAILGAVGAGIIVLRK